MKHIMTKKQQIKELQQKLEKAIYLLGVFQYWPDHDSALEKFVEEVRELLPCDNNDLGVK